MTKIYAFIDSQNLNLGTGNDILRDKKTVYRRWKLDFKKFFIYLKDKFKINKAILFIGYVKENQKLYSSLKSFGYKLVYKPSIKNHQGIVKGNVDAELVLHSAAIEYQNYDQAIIVSGDGDFYCLHHFLNKNHKLLKIIIPNKYSESSLLKEFQGFKIFLYREKYKLEYKQKNREASHIDTRSKGRVLPDD